eukprot:556528-Pleurochrysis_carterae.AAC.1
MLSRTTGFVTLRRQVCADRRSKLEFDSCGGVAVVLRSLRAALSVAPDAESKTPSPDPHKARPPAEVCYGVLLLLTF